MTKEKSVLADYYERLSDIAVEAKIDEDKLADYMRLWLVRVGVNSGNKVKPEYVIYVADASFHNLALMILAACGGDTDIAVQKITLFLKEQGAWKSSS